MNGHGLNCRSTATEIEHLTRNTWKYWNCIPRRAGHELRPRQLSSVGQMHPFFSSQELWTGVLAEDWEDEDSPPWRRLFSTLPHVQFHMACDHEINEQQRNYFLMEIRQPAKENENENTIEGKVGDKRETHRQWQKQKEPGKWQSGKNWKWASSSDIKQPRFQGKPGE